MAKKFKAHMMYKGKKSVMAKTMADHLRLKKQGYGHKAPSYSQGGKTKSKPVQGGTLPEVTVTANLPKEKHSLLDAIKYVAATGTTAKTFKPKQHSKIVRNSVKPIMGTPPMIGGTKMLGLGKSAFNLLKKAPSLFSKVAPKAAVAAGEVVEGAQTLSKLKTITPKYAEGGAMPNVKPDNREDLIATYKKGGKAKSTVNSAGNYTKPAMRKRLFNRIKAGTKGGRAGQWSARKAQLLAVLYKKNGGGYR